MTLRRGAAAPTNASVVFGDERRQSTLVRQALGFAALNPTYELDSVAAAAGYVTPTS
jgi:hypothetical protein